MSLTFPLALRWTPAPLRPAAAWLITSANPTEWIQEIARWNLPMPSLKLLPLPTSMNNRAASALLVIPTSSTNLAIPVTSLASPYGVIADRLYLPINARLDPDISPAELSALLLHDLQILHPSLGLIGFSESDILKIADLPAPIKIRDAKWNRAIAGSAVAPRLISVEADAPPEMQTFLESSRDDIGSKTPEKAPTTPPASFLKNPISKINRPILRAVDWVARHSPHFGAATNWIDALGHWASAHLRAVDEKIDSARLSELQRLISMMDSNPDQGLQYAIPLGDVPTRGVAPPASTLAHRPADFNLSRLRGASPADPWQVPWQIRQRLLAQYRAAANRELALGRFRRAAYIFAELLGDYSSAASALRQGKHFQEAATLYRDHLRNPSAAAECLEEGGQLLQAAEIFESLNLWLKAGDLHARIDHPADAARCWRNAVHDNIQRRDYLSAANLLETRLAQPDEALALLISAWPASDKSGQCLAESFELLSRLGRHDHALQRIAKLLSDSAPQDRLPSLAQTLSTVARVYPSTAVRAAAADATRVVAGNALPVAGRAETAALVLAVTRLASEDRLLSRDGNRFTSAQLQRPRAYAPSRSASKNPTLISTFNIPGITACQQVLAHDQLFHALATLQNGNQCLIHGNFAAQFQFIDLQEMQFRDLFRPPSTIIPRLIALSANNEVINRRLTFPGTAVFSSVCDIDKPAWMPLYLRGLCFAGEVAWLITHIDVGLSAYDASTGRLLARHPIDFEIADHVLMAAHGSSILIISDKTLFEFPSNTVRDLPSPARNIVTDPFGSRRIAITLQDGVMLIWPDGNQQLLAYGLFNPIAAFLPTGVLLILSRDGGRAFVIQKDQAICRASFAPFAADPIAVVPSRAPDEFVLFTASGQIRTYLSNFSDL